MYVSSQYVYYVNLQISNSPCQDGNARFTTINLKILSDQVWIMFMLITL